MTKRYYVLPGRFFEDTVDCDGLADLGSPGYDDLVVGTLPKGRYLVRVSDAEAAGIRSRAAYYVAEGVSGLGSEYAGLVASARATLRAIDTGGHDYDVLSGTLRFNRWRPRSGGRVGPALAGHYLDVHGDEIAAALGAVVVKP